MTRQFAVLAVAALALAACAKEKADEAAKIPQESYAVQGPGHRPAYPVQAADSLKALAKITVDSAARIALSRVPGGAIAKAELEREENALQWSFDLKVEGQLGLSEVNVDAVTGSVGPVEHENAATEAREAKEDSAVARRPAAQARSAARAPKRP